MNWAYDHDQKLQRCDKLVVRLPGIGQLRSVRSLDEIDLLILN